MISSKRNEEHTYNRKKERIGSFNCTDANVQYGLQDAYLKHILFI
jgi:hypothetical protein